MDKLTVHQFCLTQMDPNESIIIRIREDGNLVATAYLDGGDLDIVPERYANRLVLNVEHGTMPVLSSPGVMRSAPDVGAIFASLPCIYVDVESRRRRPRHKQPRAGKSFI